MVILIEVGKTYRNREGEKVSIVGRLPHPRLCYRGDDDHAYREDGGFRFSQDDGESEFDLVAEWVEPQRPEVTPATEPGTEASIRLEFEEWALGQGYSIYRMPGNPYYYERETAGAWEEWQSKHLVIPHVGGTVEATVKRTLGGPKLYLNGILLRTWSGSAHDAVADELCRQINAALCVEVSRARPAAPLGYCPMCGRPGKSRVLV